MHRNVNAGTAFFPIVLDNTPTEKEPMEPNEVVEVAVYVEVPEHDKDKDDKDEDEVN